MTAAPDVKTCRQHPQGCRPQDRHVRSLRVRDDTWELIESTARGGRSDATTFITDATEAALGYACCWRCGEPVPVKFGNLAGRSLAVWIAEAVRTVTAQHKDGHKPARIGFDAEPDESPAGEIPATVLMEPVLMEPGGKPVVAAVPERAKGRR